MSALARHSDNRKPEHRQPGNVAGSDTRAGTDAGLACVEAAELLLATCGFAMLPPVDVVVIVGANALLLFWRGYANPATQTRPAPRFRCAGCLVAEIASALVLANLETRHVAGSRGAVAGQCELCFAVNSGTPSACNVEPRTASHSPKSFRPARAPALSLS